jgi:hypothetical protein
MLIEYHEDCCYGHYQDDRLFDAIHANRTSYVGPSNREIHERTDPTSDDYSMPYIYDHFEWPHCLVKGIDMNELIESLYYNISSSRL